MVLLSFGDSKVCTPGHCDERKLVPQMSVNPNVPPTSIESAIVGRSVTPNDPCNSAMCSRGRRTFLHVDPLLHGATNLMIAAELPRPVRAYIQCGPS